MVTQTGVATDRVIEVPRDIYPLQYSPRLVRTRADFYDTLQIAAKMAVAGSNNLGLPTAGEEQHIYVQSSASAKRLRGVEELMDYFAKNEERWFAWGHTLTGMRVPKEYVGRRCAIGEKVPVQVIVTDIAPYLSQIADPEFTRENWKDIIGHVNKVKGEVAVPYSRGHVITEMHPLGIFTGVEQTTEHNAPFALHGWLRENLDIPEDPISGYHDLAVGRRCGWHRDVDRCLDVAAHYGRWHADSVDGFRPVVRGSVPEGKI